VKYKKDNNDVNYMLTTLTQRTHLSTIVRNIIENLENYKMLWENHAFINEHHNESLDPNNPDIMENIDHGEPEPHTVDDKFINYKNNRLISRVDAMTYLNND
jgi:hypothetical protein